MSTPATIGLETSVGNPLDLEALLIAELLGIILVTPAPPANPDTTRIKQTAPLTLDRNTQ